MNAHVFIGWLKYAIGRIGEGYYGQSERVYCYELYHFLRVAMYAANVHTSHPSIFLHSELVKVVLDEGRAGRMGLCPLDAQRSPDFILHEPSTAEHQIAALEVKVAPNLGYADFIDDIRKLGELKANYRFNVSIFHCINTNLDRVRQHLTRATREGFTVDGSILILAVPEFGSPLQEATIAELS